MTALKNGTPLSEDKTTLLQRTTFAMEKSLEGKHFQEFISTEQANELGLAYPVTSALARDRKLSESELVEAKKQAEELLQAAADQKAGKLTEQDLTLMQSALEDSVRKGIDSSYLASNYIVAHLSRITSLVPPKEPNFTFFGRFNGENEKEEARLLNEIPDYLKRLRDASNRDFKELTRQSPDKDEVLKSTLKNLGQANLIDDMLPYGSTQMSPATPSPETPREQKRN
jgi:hypothetical protein